MNIQQLRKSLKIKWVKYYHQNRPWLAKMRIWGTYDGYRRPYSGFILATLSVLEPKLDEFFPFILELNNNPDEIIAALGLNFNPEEESNLIEDLNKSVNQNQVASNSLQAEVFVDKFKADSSKDTEIKAPTSSSSTAITKIESFPFPQEVQSRLESESIEKEFQAFSELLQEHPPQEFPESSMIAKLESEEEVLSLLTMCNQAEEQSEIKESNKQETEEIKAASRKKASKLASWIDEFCQGAGWDREEAIFIPF
ncbi:MAG: DUF5331 domain-containing protein [Cyanobacteria bacterium J06633_8]